MNRNINLKSFPSPEHHTQRCIPHGVEQTFMSAANCHNHAASAAEVRVLAEHCICAYRYSTIKVDSPFMLRSWPLFFRFAVRVEFDIASSPDLGSRDE